MIKITCTSNKLVSAWIAVGGRRKRRQLPQIRTSGVRGGGDHRGMTETIDGIWTKRERKSKSTLTHSLLFHGCVRALRSRVARCVGSPRSCGIVELWAVPELSLPRNTRASHRQHNSPRHYVARCRPRLTTFPSSRYDTRILSILLSKLHLAPFMPRKKHQEILQLKKNKFFFSIIIKHLTFKKIRDFVWTIVKSVSVVLV